MTEWQMSEQSWNMLRLHWEVILQKISAHSPRLPPCFQPSMPLTLSLLYVTALKKTLLVIRCLNALWVWKHFINALFLPNVSSKLSAHSNRLQRLHSIFSPSSNRVYCGSLLVLCRCRRKNKLPYYSAKQWCKYKTSGTIFWHAGAGTWNWIS